MPRMSRADREKFEEEILFWWRKGYATPSEIAMKMHTNDIRAVQGRYWYLGCTENYMISETSRLRLVMERRQADRKSRERSRAREAGKVSS